MTAIELSRECPDIRVRYDLVGALQAAWRAFAANRRERRNLVAIARLPEHVIRDMGLDPEQVFAALDGSWDEVDPAAWRGRYLPRRQRI